MTLKSISTISPLDSLEPKDRESLKGKRVAMIMYSTYPADPRPRRAAETLLKQGMCVDLACLQDAGAARRERRGNFEIIRVPLTHKRGGKFSYAFKYSSFIVIATFILAMRSLRRRYDLVYIHNMPDVLVASALIPKMFGAKVILDQHDPMPELMMTIFGLDQRSLGVRVLAWLEKWSIARADLVITVNSACKRLFGTRSCSPEKIGVIMNSPDETIFPFKTGAPEEVAERCSPRPFVMMYHGSLVERNGLDLAVEALIKVRASIPTAELRVYGQSTPFLRQVLETARNADLRSAVSYLGPRRLEDLVQEIDACDLGLIPNHRSAFAEINTPTRIFEYLARGKPVIAPRAVGISDYFNEESMVFFELGNAADLADKIQYVFSHPEEIAGTVQQGQVVYREHCWQTEKQRLIELVGGLLSPNVGRSKSTNRAPQVAPDAGSSS